MRLFLLIATIITASSGVFLLAVTERHTPPLSALRDRSASAPAHTTTAPAYTTPQPPSRTSVPRTDPQERTITFTQNGRQYTVTVRLYGSLYHYYFHRSDAPPPATAIRDPIARYYSTYLFRVSGDDALASIAQQLRAIVARERGSTARLVALAAAFVQSIPYDTPKAQRLLATDGPPERAVAYPYETLWQQTGICADKSLLLYALLRELGFGVALLQYPAQRHMAVGVACPPTAATYDAGYCYIETTGRVPVGVVPPLDRATNRAQARVTDFTTLLNAQRILDAPKILLPVSGRAYTGLTATHETLRTLTTLQASLAAAARNIAAQRKDLKRTRDKLAKLRKKLHRAAKKHDRKQYNRLVEKYNASVTREHRIVRALNARITTYNATAARYNTLLKRLDL